MLKYRLITSLILVPLILAILFYAGPWFLLGIVFIILMMCGWEWTRLIVIKQMFYRILFILLLTLSFWASSQWYNYWLAAGLCMWFIILFAVLSYPSSENIWGKKSVVSISGLILLPLFVQSLIGLYQLPEGKWLVLYLLLLIWAADIGAYFAGKQWGRHKLIPRVSPGKSWEGVLGGLSLVVLVSLCGYFWLKPEPVWLWIVLALAIAWVSILGDLFISMLKRRCQLKDTGALLPGHGGILDRLDSLIAALPFFYFGLTLFSFRF